MGNTGKMLLVNFTRSVYQ